MAASACNEFVSGVGQQLGIGIVRIFAHHLLAVITGLLRQAHTSAYQEKVVAGIGNLFVLGIVSNESEQGLACQGEVAKPLLLQHAGLEQGVAQYLVRCGHLLLRYGYLLQVEGLVSGVVLHAVVEFLFLIVSAGVFPFLGLHQFGQPLGHLSVHGKTALVGPSPVVGVPALAPLAEEGVLALEHGIGVAEIPALPGFVLLHLPVGVLALLLGSTLGSHCIVARSAVCGIPLCLLFLLLDVFLCQAFGNRYALLFRQLGQKLQAVLQFYGGKRFGKALQRLCPLLHLLVFVVLLVQRRKALLVAACRLCIVFLFPVQGGQTQEQCSLGASALALLQAILPGIGAAQGIPCIQVYVAYGQVYLVGILLVLAALGHALQLAYHLACLRGAGHFRLEHTGIEAHLIGRVGTDNLLQGIVCLLALSRFAAQLPEQKVEAGAGYAALLPADGLLEQGYGLLVLPCLYEPCRTAVVVLLLCP